ncbi:MAG: hypothetical protein A3F92_03265 [Candidatus Rokubacteria bacterium RIFCSPLOWO2_12_FULL_71_22]|nr:MAG: hypothetical protein A3F92_03265 [Candidatus Rokubacteria bacterium RIFCSPLOWO2_12_FULL_71_22]
MRKIALLAAAVLAGVVFSSASTQATVVFFDDFNSGASAAWGNERGNWRADGGIYDATNPNNTPTTYTSVTTLPALTDFVVDVDVNGVNDGGVWLRSSFSSGTINGVLLVTGGFSGVNNGLYWHTVVNNGFSGILNNGLVPGLQGSNVHLRVVVSGDTYSAYVNDALLTTLTTSLFSSGHVGLYDFSPITKSSTPRGQTFDNFQLSVAQVSVAEPGVLGLVALGLAALRLARRGSA